MTAPQLVARELEVLVLAARGRNVDETAAELHRSRGTVKHHRAAVLDKLAARNMAEAVRIGFERGILTHTPDRLQLTDGQRRAFHKKAADVDELRELEPRTTKREMLAQASLEFGRPIESVNDLDRREASLVLDLLERMLDGAIVRAGAGAAGLLEAATR